MYNVTYITYAYRTNCLQPSFRLDMYREARYLLFTNIRHRCVLLLWKSSVVLQRYQFVWLRTSTSKLDTYISHINIYKHKYERSSRSIIPEAKFTCSKWHLRVMIQDVGRATVIQTGTKKLPFVTVRLQPCVDIWLAGCVIRLNRGGRDCTPQDYAVIATSVSVSAEQRNWFARGVDAIPDTRPVR